MVVQHKYHVLNKSKANQEPIPRHLFDVLIVCASMMSSLYEKEAYKILRRSFYKSPEIVGESWNELSRLIFTYLMDEKGYKDLELDFLESDDRLLLEILADQVDYRDYLLVDPSEIKNEQDFRNKIQLNRQKLTEK